MLNGLLKTTDTKCYSSLVTPSVKKKLSFGVESEHMLDQIRPQKLFRMEGVRIMTTLI